MLPQILHDDPPFYAEGLRWIRMDLSPPLERIYQDGRMYERPFALASTESEAPPPGTSEASSGVTEFFPIALGADDADVYNDGTTRFINSLDQVTAQRWSSRITVGLLRFDTSLLPDSATIIGATLRISPTSISNSENRNLTADWYTGAWDASAYVATAQAGALAGSPLSGMVVGVSKDIVLENFATNVNKGGYTALRLHISGVATSNNQRLMFAAKEHASYPEPRLIVTYTT